MRKLLLLLVLLLPLAAPSKAQLCTDVSAEVSVEFGAQSLSTVTPDPTDSLVALSVSTTFQFRDTSNLSSAGSESLGGGLVGQAVWLDSDPHPFQNDWDAIVASDNASLQKLSPSSGMVTKAWERNFQRAGCTGDALGSLTAHMREPATPDFAATHATDLIYVGTSYSSVTSGGGSCGGEDSDNRLIAVRATDGATAWIFNSLKTDSVDTVSGLVLDLANDTLFAATERTASVNQHSVWAIDVLTGTKTWSVNAGRIQNQPILHDGRIYLATLEGAVKALDATNGSEIWSVDSFLPYTVDPTLVELAGGDTLIVAVDYLGSIRVVRDDDTAGTSINYITLPGGVVAAGPPIVDATGKALIGGNDGKVYPLDLLAGSVGTPITVDAATASVEHLLLEPPGLFATPASFLATTSDGLLARYCTTLGAPAAVPALGPLGLGGLAISFAWIGGMRARRASPRTEARKSPTKRTAGLFHGEPE
jgi:hypothetical protein